MNSLKAAVGGIVALSSACASPALAVPPGNVSLTAQAVCDYRAVAAQHPDAKLRNPDYLAAKLCNPVLLPHWYEAVRDVIDVDPERYSGYFYVNARTRHIDSWLERAIAEGATQVVILGAGFDSRPYRFSKAGLGVRFFEVDLPVTIRAKERAVAALEGVPPAYVRYVPTDFSSQSLESALFQAGYDATRKSAFILEGVTMYVTHAGNDATFDFIRTRSATGSTVVFDYVWRQVVEGDYAGLYAASTTAKGLAQIGEQFITGWTPSEAAEYARHHGLRVLDNLDAADLTRRYLIGSDGKADGRIPEWYGVIDAIVP
jgi:methyltransferase (TIGR00027 family)